MTWPELVPAALCRTPIRLVIEGEGLTEDGAPEVLFDEELLCNWQDGGRTELTAEEKRVRVTGRALFPGDICPQIPHITGGWGVIFGGRRPVLRGVKARNPDGTVNFTEVRFG